MKSTLNGTMGTNSIEMLRATKRNGVADLLVGFDNVTREVMPTSGQLLTAVLTIASSLIQSMPPASKSRDVLDRLSEAMTEAAPFLSAVSGDPEHTIQ